MSTTLGVYSYDCSNSVLMQLSDSCTNIRNKDKSRSRISIYDPCKPQIIYLFKSHDFNVKKSNSGTIDRYSYTSNSINAASKCLDENYSKRKQHYDYDKHIDIFHISQMSRSLHKVESREPSTISKEPVIVINQISNIDVSSVVDELLIDSDLNKVSSLFVVITSDDEVSPPVSRSKFNPTKCMQLSEYQNPWNKIAEQYWPQDQKSNITDRLTVSLKGKHYFLEGLPASIPYFKNVNTRRTQNNFTPKHIESKTKLCQITTPCEMIPIDIQELLVKNNYVTTDTTVDRLCCCKANPIPNSHNDSEHNGYVNSCASTVVSQMLIASNCLPEGLTAGPVEHLIQTQRNQPLYLPENQISGPMFTCQVNQCCVRGKCCASQNVPTQDPKHSNRVKFQTSIEQSCNCNQDKLKELFDQKQSDKLRNMTSTACGGHSDFNPIYFPTRSKPTPGQDFYRTSNQNEYVKSNTKKSVTIKTFVGTRDYLSNTPRPKFGPKYNSYSVGCQSVFKDNYVVIGPSGRRIPVLGQIVPLFPGLSRRSVNTAIQNNLGCLKYSTESPSLQQKIKCVKEPSVLYDFSPTAHFKREVGLIEIMGPSGGYSAIGSGGAWTQAGHKELRVSTAIGPGNAPQQDVNMNVNDKDNTDKINVVVTDEKGNTNTIADEVKIDVTKDQSDVTNKKTKADAGNMTLVDKIISLIKGESNDQNNALNKENKINNLFGILNMSKIKKKIKLNDESVQTEKKKRKTKCACPQDIESMADFPEEEEEEDDNSYIDPKLLLQLRSEMCETTSGFTINKRAKMSEPDVELDVSLEDAIRYYAALHPEVLSDLIPVTEAPTNKKSCSCDRHTCCECPLDSMPEPTEDNPALFELEGNEVDQPVVPFQGLSLKIPGRGATRY